MKHYFFEYSANLKDGYAWFRIMGYGLHIKDINKLHKLFSERNCNFPKCFQIKNLFFKILNRNR